MWELIDAIGGFFRNLLEGIVEGLKYLFIPADSYFSGVFQLLRSGFYEKFGSIADSVTYISERFSNLSAYRGTASMFVIEFPQDHFFSGWRMDFLQNFDGLLLVIRSGLSGFICVLTAVYVWKRVVAIVNS